VFKFIEQWIRDCESVIVCRGIMKLFNIVSMEDTFHLWHEMKREIVYGKKTNALS
jgi:hypothetical protein